jgi:hypothetical protein
LKFQVDATLKTHFLCLDVQMQTGNEFQRRINYSIGVALIDGF